MKTFVSARFSNDQKSYFSIRLKNFSIRSFRNEVELDQSMIPKNTAKAKISKLIVKRMCILNYTLNKRICAI